MSHLWLTSIPCHLKLKLISFNLDAVLQQSIIVLFTSSVQDLTSLVYLTADRFNNNNNNKFVEHFLSMIQKRYYIKLINLKWPIKNYMIIRNNNRL